MEQAAKLERREFFMDGSGRLSSFTSDRGAVCETSHTQAISPWPGRPGATYVPLNHASVNQLARRTHPLSWRRPMFKLSRSAIRRISPMGNARVPRNFPSGRLRMFLRVSSSAGGFVGLEKGPGLDEMGLLPRGRATITVLRTILICISMHAIIQLLLVVKKVSRMHSFSLFWENHLVDAYTLVCR